jgi:prenyltransferase beta subunit
MNIIKKTHLLDVDALTVSSVSRGVEIAVPLCFHRHPSILMLLRTKTQRWMVSRQMTLEGGFHGRTNKLVDSCYAFWQAGTFPLLEVYWAGKHGDGVVTSLFNRGELSN